MRLRHLLLAALLVAIAAPAGRPGEPPAGRRVSLTDGSLFVPSSFKPDHATGFELTLHLHGAPAVVEQNFMDARCAGVLANVTLPGLSAVYAAKFKETHVFWRLLREAADQVAPPGSAAPKLRRLTVTSFSAGFGGVRELLRHPAIFDRIDGLVMADSIYAGFAGDPGERRVNPENMAGFLEFARAAGAGPKQLLITHSQLHTPTYASTVETADYLIRHLGGRREEIDELWPGGLRLVSRFRAGHCEILGFAGDSGEDHMQHLRQLSRFLARQRPSALPDSPP